MCQIATENYKLLFIRFLEQKDRQQPKKLNRLLGRKIVKLFGINPATHNGQKDKRLRYRGIGLRPGSDVKFEEITHLPAGFVEYYSKIPK